MEVFSEMLMLAGRLHRNSLPALSSSPLEMFVCQQHQMLITLDARNTWPCMTHSCVGLSGLTASRDDGGKKAFKRRKRHALRPLTPNTCHGKCGPRGRSKRTRHAYTEPRNVSFQTHTHKWINRPGHEKASPMFERRRHTH